MISGVLPAFLTASLASRIPEDFAFGDSGVGVAIAIFHVVCAVSSTPAGRLVERIGPLRGMRVAATARPRLSCVTIAMFAQSASASGRCCCRRCRHAFGGPWVSALLSGEVAVHRQGLAFGAQQSGGMLGALLAGSRFPRWRPVRLALGVPRGRRARPRGGGPRSTASPPPRAAAAGARSGSRPCTPRAGGGAGERCRRRLHLLPDPLRRPSGMSQAAAGSARRRQLRATLSRIGSRPADCAAGAAAAGGGDLGSASSLPAADRRRTGADHDCRVARRQLRVGVAAGLTLPSSSQPRRAGMGGRRG